MTNPLKALAAVFRSIQGGSRSSRAVKTSAWSWRNIPLFLAAVYLPFVPKFEPSLKAGPASGTSGEQIYWGGYLDGEHYGLGNAPWETRTIELFEQNAGKQVSIIHWGQFWHWSRQSGYSGIGDGYFQKFEASLYERVRQRGAIPMINWNSWDGGAGGIANQPDYQLADILSGSYDSYIRQWARDAKAWGKPFFLRFNHEMNGDWYPWSEQANGNKPGQYVQMWRHVHDIFRQEGASNVTWVWSVNTVYDSSAYSKNLAGLYPGDAYVDWVAIDGYNWGTNPARPDQWRTFSQVLTETYSILGSIAPGKPVMLSEFGSTEYGGSKADWIKDALTVQIPANFPRIKAVVWFNKNAYEGSGKMDWVIESSSSAKNAFAAGIQSPYYAGNNFASLPSGPVRPLAEQQLPTATPNPGFSSPTGSNLIQNASFEAAGSSWMSPWNLVTGSGAAGFAAQDGTTRTDGSQSARVEITTAAAAAPWGVQVNQRSLSLISGSSVSASFWARASAPREIQVVVQMGSSPYTEHFRRTFTAGTSWQQYTFSYTQPVSDPKAMLSFNLAQTAGQVWIDQVELSSPGGSSGGLPPSEGPTPTATQPAPTATLAPALTPTSTAPVPPQPSPTAAQPGGDSQPPSVRILSPVEGEAAPRKQMLDLAAEASDNLGVARVEFKVRSNGGYSWSCTAGTQPYSCTWPVPPSAGAEYTLQATAYDQAGNAASHEIALRTK